MLVDWDECPSQLTTPRVRLREEVHCTDGRRHIDTLALRRESSDLQMNAKRILDTPECDWLLKRTDLGFCYCFTDDPTTTVRWISEAAPRGVQEEPIACLDHRRISSSMGRKRHRLLCQDPSKRLSISDYKDEVTRHESTVSLGCHGSW